MPEYSTPQESIESTACTSQTENPRGLPEFIESNAKQSDELKSIVPSVLSRADYDENKDISEQTTNYL